MTMKTVSIFVGSVYGNAQHVAEQAQELLTKQGVKAKIYEDAKIDDFKQAEAVLVIASTTGQGDIPENLLPLCIELREQFPLMQQKPFAVAGLGDSSYGETFCAAGKQVHELLCELQGKAVADLLVVDACETLEPEKEVLPWLASLVDKLS